MTKFHSGNHALDSLRDECMFVQNKEQQKLVHLQGAEVEIPVNSEQKLNKAEYSSVNGDFSKIPELVFKPILSPQDIVTGHSQIAAAGGYFIFDEILFIGGQEQRVLGYGII